MVLNLKEIICSKLISRISTLKCISTETKGKETEAVIAEISVVLTTQNKNVYVKKLSKENWDLWNFATLILFYKVQYFYLGVCILMEKYKNWEECQSFPTQIQLNTIVSVYFVFRKYIGTKLFRIIHIRL